nr:hypothetical protein [Tanacetum cinerariifolium]
KAQRITVNRMKSGLNTRFWTRKDMDRSKEFMFAIQKRLKTKRIFCNLESFVGRRVAVCSRLRSPKSKCTIESRAKRSSKIISLGHDSTLLASSHTVKSKTDIKSPTHYPFVGFNSLVYSLRALSALRRSDLRTVSTTAKPCQGDSSEFYLITGRILTVAAAGQKDVNLQLHAHSSNSLSADEEGRTTVVGCENDVSIQKSNGLATLEKKIETSVSSMDINPINNSTDEEGETIVVGCENDASIQKSNGLATLEMEMETRTDGKQMLHNKELLKDCYKVSIDTSLVDAACIPDVGNNGFKTVEDAVGLVRITWEGAGAHEMSEESDYVWMRVQGLTWGRWGYSSGILAGEFVRVVGIMGNGPSSNTLRIWQIEPLNF